MDVGALKAAGAAAVAVNCPAGPARVAAVAGWAAGTGARSIVDLGCGRGRWLVEILRAAPDTTGTGIDVDAAALAAAAATAAEAGVADRARWVEGDAGAWTGSADLVLCVGSTHAAGGIAALGARLAALPVGRALLADGVWVAEPDAWCAEHLGEHHRVEPLTAELRTQGWEVEAVELSAPEEWDAFEAGWVAGVRSVGTPAAEAFAAEREAQYRDHYREVLGFAWFRLRQATSRSSR